MKQAEIFKAAVEKWGSRAQLEMAQEEATELALAIRKHIRSNDPNTFHAMADEIADMEIMIGQIKSMFPGIGKCVGKQKAFKMKRLKNRIDTNTFTPVTLQNQ